VVTKDTTYMKR